ncbi:homeobox protein prospero isoform X2 [Anthonomus grandis grandis]|uniref:homeobox protein prospero isoform X2 n=1 Tax=Anthonomus grandis grandis TaxID=2921223 RepID=UPI0021667ABA|nr:homeobox protein prospero isoform X2 [Anthonomus grandis grandis]
MMSSEEETEFGLYTDKLLKKTKRTRQRVDAGEPRNSYSSIPNFSSRPNFLGTSGNLYGAIFTQHQQFGLFGPGFAPAKMLNELLGRQKSENGGDSEDSVIRCDGSPPSGEALAHHMLRDILQGRKHELLALEHDMRNGQEHIMNNNNNEPKASPERSDPESAMKECLAEAGVDNRQQELMEDAINGMETDSLPSPKVEPASPAKPEDAKKARVENIVSGMRSSPAPPQVNGCKKRKLYQPQQHDSNADRYIDDEEEDAEPIKQKRVEKNLLKSQLRTMQEQLAEMQQKYMQLCTRVEQGSEESQEIEEIPSDGEQSPKRSPPPSPTTTTSPPTPTQITPTLAQEVSKMKISPPGPPFHNGLLHAPHHMNNAAAMYLGHKLLMEQEARLAKEAAAAAAMNNEVQQQQQQQQQQASQPQHLPPSNPKPDNISERLQMMRSITTPTGTDLEGLADALKTEITSSLSNLIDSIMSRFVHQKRCKNQDAATAAEQLNKDLLMASQLLDRKSPRTKVAERPQGPPPPQNQNHMVNGNVGPQMMHVHSMHNNSMQKPSDLHIRPPMFQPPKPPPGISQAPLYGMNHPFCVQKQQDAPEQNEALSLVVAPKKKRHKDFMPFKVTDTRITPRTVSRILGQEGGMGMSPASMEPNSGGQPSCPSPRPPPYHQPPPMLPVSLPTSVAIPNPGLHESQVFSPYSPFFHGPSHGHHMAMQASSSPPRMHKMERESPPVHHPPTLLHPALLAAAQHGGSPDYGHMRGPSGGLSMDNGDRNSDCNSGDISYDGMQPTISFLCKSSADYSKSLHSSSCHPNISLTPEHSSTLTPMHLRKAKLMFFWVRYPSSAVLKMYFPDIKFNKNNTAQLVKWFSNFREFYYIQMEKYARQAVSEGVKNADDLHVGGDSELYRVLNLHYNRNNHIEVPSNFRFVVEQTLREFFKAIQEGRDAEQSWKKSIYKIISRMDDPVPEYFKSPNFLEQLE